MKKEIGSCLILVFLAIQVAAQTQPPVAAASENGAASALLKPQQPQKQESITLSWLKTWLKIAADLESGQALLDAMDEIEPMRRTG